MPSASGGFAPRPPYRLALAIFLAFRFFFLHETNPARKPRPPQCSLGFPKSPSLQKSQMRQCTVVGECVRAPTDKCRGRQERAHLYTPAASVDQSLHNTLVYCLPTWQGRFWRSRDGDIAYGSLRVCLQCIQQYNRQRRGRIICTAFLVVGHGPAGTSTTRYAFTPPGCATSRLRPANQLFF